MLLKFKVFICSVSYKEGEECNNRPSNIVSGDSGPIPSYAIIYSESLAKSLNFSGAQFTMLQNKRFGLDQWEI